MRITVKPEKQLVSEFFSNIGVAWFAGGVISAFNRGFSEIFQSLISIIWGITLSLVFLFIGIIIINRKIWHLIK